MSAADRIAGLYAAADTARAAGRPNEAARHFEAIIALDPRQPKALNALGVQALAAGGALRAVELFAAATAADPRAIELWLNLANAQRAAGNEAGEIASLDAVLAIEPYQVMALLQKAQAQERHGDTGAAAKNYGAILQIVGGATLPPTLAAAVAHGQQVIAAEQAALGATIMPHIAGPRAAASGARSRRFDHAVEVLLGKSRIYPSTPTGLTYPGLPATEYFERTDFPWLAALEAATPIIQREFAGLMTGATDAFVPYVDFPEGIPINQWGALNGSLDWSALFLWKDGVRNEANCRRCPATAALLASLPLLDIPGRGPAAFFSVLRAGAHIPPHVGVTNIRSVVHIPLVIPSNCALRVGSQVREWRIGEALAFDDTIEHEAWNRSVQHRAVLIVDAWNPHLDGSERALLRALTVGMDAHTAAR